MKQPEDTLTVDMFEQLEPTLSVAERIAAAKAQVALDNSPVNNEILIHLYVASSLEMYVGYFKKMQDMVAAWGVVAPLIIPKLAEYHAVCPTCGKIVGKIETLGRHKLIARRCAQCEGLFKEFAPIVDGYALQELAKLMQQDPDAVEHFICSALMARRWALI